MVVTQCLSYNPLWIISAALSLFSMETICIASKSLVSQWAFRGWVENTCEYTYDDRMHLNFRASPKIQVTFLKKNISLNIISKYLQHCLHVDNGGHYHKTSRNNMTHHRFFTNKMFTCVNTNTVFFKITKQIKKRIKYN